MGKKPTPKTEDSDDAGDPKDDAGDPKDGPSGKVKDKATRGPKPSQWRADLEGKFRTWCEAQEGTAKGKADRLGITANQMKDFLRGIRKPSTRLQDRIEAGIAGRPLPSKTSRTKASSGDDVDARIDRILADALPDVEKDLADGMSLGRSLGFRLFHAIKKHV
jgi:hypothetical protein